MQYKLTCIFKKIFLLKRISIVCINKKGFVLEIQKAASSHLVTEILVKKVDRIWKS